LNEAGIAAVVVAACGGGISMPSDLDTLADKRAAMLVAQMTTDEKIQIVHGIGFPVLGLGGPFPAGVDGAGYIPGIPRLGIPGLASADSSGGANVPNSGSTALPAPIASAPAQSVQAAAPERNSEPRLLEAVA